MSLDCFADCWKDRCGSKAIREIAHADHSEDYEMEQMHVFELSNGQFVTVNESGCSCYDPSEALLELFPSKKAAMVSYLKYQKDYNVNNLSYLESIYDANNELDK